MKKPARLERAGQMRETSLPDTHRIVAPENKPDATGSPIAENGGNTPHDARLIARGYEPIAVNGKIPVATGWPMRPNTVEALEAEREHSHAVSTGLRTGHLVGIDIDLRNPEHVAAIKGLAAEVLGYTSMERIGAKGAMLLYRNASPIDKITITYEREDGKRPSAIEILGTGQQLVAYGIHPDTGKPYYWPNADMGDEPLCRALADLPEVTPDKLREFARLAAGVLTGLGYRKPKVSGPGVTERGPLPAPAGFKEDTPRAIHAGYAEVQRWIALGKLPIGGNRNVTVHALAAKLRAIGCSEAMSVRLIEDTYLEAPGAEAPDEAVDFIVASAYRSKPRNPPGSELPKTGAETFAGAQGLGEYSTDAAAERGAEEYDEPLDLFSDTAPEPVLTRDMLPAAEAVEYAFDVAERVGVDPAITVSAMLAVAAVAIHDDIRIQRKAADTEHLERAHANILIVAEPGGGKTPAINAIVAPLKRIEDEWQAEDASRAVAHELAMKIYAKREKTYLEKFNTLTTLDQGPEMPRSDAPVAPPKPQRRRILVSDTTIEALMDVLNDNPRGVLNVQDETMGFIAGFDAYRNGSAGKDRAFWLQTDNGGSYSVDRVGKRFHVPNLGAGFIGGIQPGKLREIAAGLSTDGFIQRAFVVNVGLSHKEQDRPANIEARAAYERLLRGLLALAPSVPPRPIVLSAGAHLFREHVEKIAGAYITLPTTSDALRQHLAKWKGKFARLLLLFHAIECVAGGRPLAIEVSAETAERAARFMMDFVLPHAMWFYAEFFQNADQRGPDARWIAGYILARKLERVTARQLKKDYRDLNSNADRCVAAMKVLTDCRWVGEPEQRRIGGGEGLYWEVNARVHVLYAERAAAEAAQREAIRAEIAKARGVMREANGALSALSLTRAERENNSDDDDEKKQLPSHTQGTVQTAKTRF